MLILPIIRKYCKFNEGIMLLSRLQSFRTIITTYWLYAVLHWSWLQTNFISYKICKFPRMTSAWFNDLWRRQQSIFRLTHKWRWYRNDKMQISWGQRENRTLVLMLCSGITNANLFVVGDNLRKWQITPFSVGINLTN